jgi:hypothetical protein
MDAHQAERLFELEDLNTVDRLADSEKLELQNLRAAEEECIAAKVAAARREAQIQIARLHSFEPKAAEYFTRIMHESFKKRPFVTARTSANAGTPRGAKAVEVYAYKICERRCSAAADVYLWLDQEQRTQWDDTRLTAREMERILHTTAVAEKWTAHKCFHFMRGQGCTLIIGESRLVNTAFSGSCNVDLFDHERAGERSPKAVKFERWKLCFGLLAPGCYEYVRTL